MKNLKRLFKQEIEKNGRLILQILFVWGVIACAILTMGDGLVKEMFFKISFDLMFMIVAVFCVVPILKAFIAFISTKNAFEYTSVDKFVEDAPKKDLEYYRNMSKVESPLLINKVRGRKVTKNVVVAELLSLEKRGFIRFENDNIVILTKEKLLRSEETFLDYIEEGKLKITSVERYMKNMDLLAGADLRNDSRWYNLRNLSNKERMVKFCVRFLPFLVIVVWVIASGFGGEIEKFGVEWWATLLPIFYVTGVYFGLSCPPKAVFEETAEFKKLREELAGLEKFLDEYSMLSERDAEEIKIWEDYLIYSVLFGQNTKIVEDYDKYIEWTVDIDAIA